MENLTFVHRGQLISRRIIGVMFIGLAITFLILSKDSLKTKEVVEAGVFFIWGLLYFTPLLGSNESCIGYGEGNLEIKWRGWILKVTIPESEIEKVSLFENYISISRRNKKPVRIEISSMDKVQKTQVYEFVIKYARQKNLTLEK